MDNNDTNPLSVADVTDELIRQEVRNAASDNDFSLTIGSMEELVNPLQKLISKAKSSITVVSDTLNPKLFGNKTIVDAVSQRLAKDVQLDILMGSYIVTPAGGSNEHNLLLSFKELLKRGEYESRIKLFRRINRPPAFHYLIIDNKCVVAETLHKLGDESRRYFKFTGQKIVDLFKNKYNYCIQESYNLSVGSIDEYEFVDKFSNEYKSEYNEAMDEADIKTAGENPDEWLSTYLIREKNIQIARESVEKYFSEYGAEPLKNAQYLSQNYQEISLQYEGSWIAICGKKILASGASYDEVKCSVTKASPQIKNNDLLI